MGKIVYLDDYRNRNDNRKQKTKTSKDYPTKYGKGNNPVEYGGGFWDDVVWQNPTDTWTPLGIPEGKPNKR